MRLVRAHRGLSLIELIVAITLAALVGSTLFITLRRQQRFYSSATEMIQVRAQLRDAADVLAADIRSAAVARYGLPLMTDTALELFATIGSSVVCATPSGPTLFLPPASLTSGTALTSFLASPDTGDLALIYAMPGADPDSGRWIESAIAGFATRAVSTSCPATTGFTAAADAVPGRSGYAVTFPATVPATVRKGAPVRFLRRGRYSLYRSSDGEWYLGYRRCNAVGRSVCSTIQPVSGPYLPYGNRAIGETGLAFRYFDGGGSELFDASLSPTVARVDVVLRGETAREVSLTGDARRRYRDSTIISISPRNRVR
jgi:prepilin-type N-terminal cleavage/methylation domain-containing protein